MGYVHLIHGVCHLIHGVCAPDSWELCTWFMGYMHVWGLLRRAWVMAGVMCMCGGCCGLHVWLGAAVACMCGAGVTCMGDGSGVTCMSGSWCERLVWRSWVGAGVMCACTLTGWTTSCMPV